MLLYSCITSAAPLNLGPVCQNMWNMAGNNLQVPAELKVVVGNNPLFKLELTGEAKINASIPFKTFEGSYYLECLLFLKLSQLNELSCTTLLVLLQTFENVFKQTTWLKYLLNILFSFLVNCAS